MKTKTQQTEIEICVDCYFYYHYGDESFNESQHLNNEEKQHIIDSFNEISNSEKIYSFYDDEETIDFSKTPCDICESLLAGNRFKMLIELKTKERKGKEQINLI